MDRGLVRDRPWPPRAWQKGSGVLEFRETFETISSRPLILQMRRFKFRLAEWFTLSCTADQRKRRDCTQTALLENCVIGQERQVGGERSGAERYLVCRTEIEKYLFGYEAQAVPQSGHEGKSLPQRRSEQVLRCCRNAGLAKNRIVWEPGPDLNSSSCPQHLWTRSLHV